MLLTILFPSSDGDRRFYAVHFRHLNVHENQVKALAAESREGLFSIARDNNYVAAFLKQSSRELLIDRVVLCQKDMQRAASLAEGMTRDESRRFFSRGRLSENLKQSF